MSMETCTAFLTPDFPVSAKGKVHSVFKRTVNAELLCKGEARILTLLPKALPKLPDSIQVAEKILAEIQEGMPVELNPGHIAIGQMLLPYKKDDSFDGRISDISKKLLIHAVNEFLSSTDNLCCGLNRLPPDYRKKVTDALSAGELSSHIGLGAGLTPSFDDACVGYMAVCRALGAESNLIISADTDTTDISLRYLKLAQKGYFGEPIVRVINALIGDDELQDSLQALKEVGATSGCDMIYGMRLAINKLLNFLDLDTSSAKERRL